MKLDLFFNVAKCCVAKGDYPEVTSVLLVLTPILREHWRAATTAALKDLEEALDQLEELDGSPDVKAVALAEDRDRALEDIIAALLLVMAQEIGRPLRPSATDAVRTAAGRLLGDGARVAGVGLDQSKLDYLLSYRAAIADLPLLLRGIFERRQRTVEALLRDYLTRGAARRNLSPTETALLPPAERPLPRTRAEWLLSMGTLLDRSGASAVPFVADLWAYRWFNIGGVLGGLQAGVAAFEIRNNPPFGPDEKTTSFCRWVHGRIVSAERASIQMRNLRAAISAGDVEAAAAAWPFVQANAPVETFAAQFENVGLPPYHGRCRSKPYPVFG